ncbi:DNA-3-methyladenine glycosylase family protein [Paenibacillus koleovorans]|uniref:DNA-3-methyladenine glycosylase family protein n=1 Tax=Paenibacillus koleovorans TaxID=121608 RepID=UPI000FDCB181|nr:DNA-3-methyladenine glycosylase [Paenibacillus koleovorans]
MTTRHPDTRGFNFDERTGQLTTTLSIPTPETFRFRETLHYLTRSPAELLHQVEGDRVYKLLELGKDGLPQIVEIAENAGQLEIRLAVTGDRTGTFDEKVILKKAADYVREWFDLDRDLSPFYDLATDNPLLEPLTRDFYGLRIIGVPDLFEALCWAIIGQQVNLTFAYTLKKRLVETYGRSVTWNNRTHWRFPRPAELLQQATVEKLRQLQLTGKKAEFLLGIAQLMEEDSLSKPALLAAVAEAGGDFRAAEELLTAIRGIGPWTAHYVGMRCLRNPQALPVGDAGLQNALKQLLRLDRKPTEPEIRQLFAPWRGWEAYAVFYFWRSLAG